MYRSKHLWPNKQKNSLEGLIWRYSAWNHSKRAEYFFELWACTVRDNTEGKGVVLVLLTTWNKWKRFVSWKFESDDMVADMMLAKSRARLEHIPLSINAQARKESITKSENQGISWGRECKELMDTFIEKTWTNMFSRWKRQALFE